MSTVNRRILGAIVLGVMLASVYAYLSGTPSSRLLLYRLFMIGFWWPLKGALLRFLGGRRPYRSALAANASSELIGLGFSLGRFGLLWPGLVVSFGASTVIEGLTLTAMGTAATLKSFGMSLYTNVVVHVLTAGMIVWASRPGISIALFLGGFVLFILPIFVVERPLGESS